MRYSRSLLSLTTASDLDDGYSERLVLSLSLAMTYTRFSEGADRSVLIVSVSLRPKSAMKPIKRAFSLSSSGLTSAIESPCFTD